MAEVHGLERIGIAKLYQDFLLAQINGRHCAYNRCYKRFVL